MNCRICDSSKVKPFRAFNRAYGRCSRCKTVQREMTALQYRALDVTYDSGASLATVDRVELERALGVQGAAALLERYKPAGAATLLDIGCGMGAYLRAGEMLGLKVTGYEPSNEHSEIARKVFGFDVRSEYFEGTAEKFDYILLSHVIEHIYDPRAFLAVVLASLNPGGRLLVVTPNADSLAARATGARWPMLVPEDHVTILTRQSLEMVVADGFSVRTTTSEYSHEFLATVGAAVRARPKAICGDVSSLPGRLSMRSRLLRHALTLGSLPFHWTAIATDRRGALLGLIDRPG